MTRLLDTDWLRSVQLFHSLYSCRINDFAKTNKMAKKQNGGKPLNEGNCPRGTLKAKGLTNKSTKF